MNAVDATESFLPPEVPRSPQVAFSTGSSWKAVAASYDRAIEPQIRVSEVQQLVASARVPGNPRLATANALLQLLHDQVRYTGIEFGEAALIPRTPGQTLERKYGDCKDQAALLVAMLRAAGIPAQLALLSAGNGHDIEPDLPGIGLFDHAIVYAPGEPDLWADPTDEFALFNQLPVEDQNRYALIIREDGDLVKTPDLPSSENRFVETREFLLAESGGSTAIEITEASGSVERSYRRDYTEADASELKETLKAYAKSAYLSDSDPVIKFSAPGDLSKPFQLRLEMKNAERGSTGPSDAAVGIPLADLTTDSPNCLDGTNPAKLPPQGRTDVISTICR